MLQRLCFRVTSSKTIEDFIIGTKTVLLHRVLIYTAPHRDIDSSPKYLSFHRRIKVNDIFMIRNIHFLNFSMVSIWAPINTSLEWQNNATKCITNTKRCIPQHIHRFHNTYTFYSTTHTFHNDHPHRCHSLQLLKPYFTGKHYYFLQHYKFLQLQ